MTGIARRQVLALRLKTARKLHVYSQLSLLDGHHQDLYKLCVLERCLAYRGIRYSRIAEKRRVGTYTSCPSYRGVPIAVVSVKRELTVLPFSSF